jgi:hypothetical protein
VEALNWNNGRQEKEHKNEDMFIDTHRIDIVGIRKGRAFPSQFAHRKHG